MSVILTADMEGFSSWMQRDEKAVIALLVDTYYRYAEEMVRRFDGVLFQKEGDAIWCLFEDPDRALDGGLWILERFRDYNRLQKEEDVVRLRVGLAFGGREHGVLNQAKKLESSAAPGAVHFEREVYQRLKESRGARVFRLAEPTYELHLSERSLADDQVLVAEVSALPPPLRLHWQRELFKACNQLETDLFLSESGLLLASFHGDEWRNLVALDHPDLKAQVFAGVTVAKAAELCSSGGETRLERAPTQPYKFLKSYMRNDSLIFFGREREAELLEERLSQAPLLLLYGKPGVGKTSLLRAGMPHRVSQLIVLRLQSRPLEQLSGALQAWSALQESGVCPVLVLDQFEQVILKCQEDEQRQFVETLEKLASGDQGSGSIIVSVREDFLGQVFALERYWPAFTQNRLRLRTLDREASESCVLGPAALFGVKLEEALVNSLVDALEEEGVHPAELQIVLDKLYRGRRDHRRISLQDYQESGGAVQILRGYLDEALDTLAGKERDHAYLLLKAFVNSNGSAEAAPYSSLSSLSGLPESVLEPLLRRLLEARLLRVALDSQAPSGTPLSYELTHQTLVERVLQWETPAEVAQRHAQLILRHEFRNYRRVGSLIPRDRLALLANPELELHISGEERLMLVWASVLHKMNPQLWMPDEEARRACRELVLGMLQDQNLAPELRRELMVTAAGLPLEDRGLEVLLLAARELVNPTILKRCQGRSPAVLKGLEQAFRYRFFSESSTVAVPAGSCFVGSTERCKEERKAVTRPDLHSRIDSEMDYQQVEVETFYMDRTAVSNELYAEFQPLHRHFFPPEEAHYPAVNVSFDEAKAYADWLGKRLPTEVEWEKAARGCKGRKFPWGNEFSSQKVNSGESEKRAHLPVDALPEGSSPFGCLQMSGNVWEWTCTPWEKNSPLMAKKGGCALNFAPLMHCSARYEDAPEMRLRWAGFRLCFSPVLS